MINAQSTKINETGSTKILNIVDGVILTEAIRYTIFKARQQFLFPVTYYIFDIKESQIPFHGFYATPFLSAVSSRQMSSYLFLRQQQNFLPAPFVNAFPFGILDGDLSISKASKELRTSFATVPPHRIEVQAIVDILEKLNWKFVSVVATGDENGRKIIADFSNLANRRGICLGTTVLMSNIVTNYAISKAVQALKKEKNATIIVSFVESTEIRGILQTDLQGFNFISGTNLRASRNEIYFNTTTAKGLILLQHDDTYDEDFKIYFMNLRLGFNNYSWFGEFWNQIFQCTIPQSLRSKFGTYKTYGKNCTGYEMLTEDLVDMRYALVKPVINAIDMMVCSLMQSVSTRTCNPPTVPAYSTECGLNIMANATKYFGKGKCNFGQFNRDGYIARRYRILNFDGIDYKEVGSWYYNITTKKSVLNISVESITFNWGSYKTTSCYKSCGKGEIQDRGSDGKKCCYTCKKCSSIDEIVQNNTCVKCKTFEVPAASRKHCTPLPRIRITSNETPVIAFMVAAAVGTASTFGAIIIFVKYRDSRVVKSAGKYLSMIMMISVTISFSTSFVFFSDPTTRVCGIQKVLLGQCLSMFYVPLLLKTVRIYRIFEASKNFIRNPMLVSIKSQMIMCIFGILGNLVLGVLFVISNPTEVKEMAIERYTKVAVICDHNPMDAVTCLVPCLILLFACTYFGYKTRQFPSNFNESFRISITMYISCFLWGIYIPLLYLFENSVQNVFMTNFITAGLLIILAFVNLIGIFGTTVIKVVKTSSVGPEVLVSSSTFNQISMENATSYTKSCKDVGTDPIEF